MLVYCRMLLAHPAAAFDTFYWTARNLRYRKNSVCRTFDGKYISSERQPQSQTMKMLTLLCQTETRQFIKITQALLHLPDQICYFDMLNPFRVSNFTKPIKVRWLPSFRSNVHSTGLELLLIFKFGEDPLITYNQTNGDNFLSICRAVCVFFYTRCISLGCWEYFCWLSTQYTILCTYSCTMGACFFPWDYPYVFGIQLPVVSIIQKNCVLQGLFLWQ